MPLNDKKLLQLRLLHNLSQNEVAKCANITQATLSYMESGKYLDYRISHIEALASFYNVSIDYLLDHEIETTKKDQQKIEDAKQSIIDSIEAFNKLINKK